MGTTHRLALCALIWICSGLAAAHATPLHLSLDDRLLEAKLRATRGERGLTVDATAHGIGLLELEPIDVFVPGARIVVHSASGERRIEVPAATRFRGRVAGRPGSRVLLSVLPNGLRGLVLGADGTWVLGRGRAAKALHDRIEVRQVDTWTELAAETASFHCDSDRLTDGDELLAALAVPRRPLPAPSPSGATKGLVPPNYTARIAIETDNEYLARFAGDTSAATSYAGDLVAYASTLYAAEVGTSLEISELHLWETPDPWEETSSRCRLFEYGRYWNQNRVASERTIGHFLSGLATNSGIAWIGVLCDAGFAYNINGQACGLSPVVDAYGGGYGFTGGIDGDFDIDQPTALWDIVAVAHEIGHNFASPHTHCYADYGGVASDIDTCYNAQSGCYGGSTSLPSGCGGSGQGCGTIMSYCHLLSGSFGNVSLTFGTGHPFGVSPERVPQRMLAHVVDRATSNPLCLAPTFCVGDACPLFADGFESGDSAAWTP